MSQKRIDDDEIPLPPHGTPPALEKRAPCGSCGTSTLVSMLGHYGARCLSCYEAYRLELQPKAAFTGDKRSNPKGWALALKAREEAGERLSVAQRDMWRAALRATENQTGDTP